MPVGDWDFGDDLEAGKPASNVVDMRTRAHIVNGGEGRAMVACPKCGGSGDTRWGACFRCDGKGQVTVRSAAASKARKTAAENADKWHVEHADLVIWLK